MDAPNDAWQVIVNGEVYDADLETLKQWVVEGAVQSNDKVRRGALNWLDAGRVPALRDAFAGAASAPPPFSGGSTSYGDAYTSQAPPSADGYSPYGTSADAPPQSYGGGVYGGSGGYGDSAHPAGGYGGDAGGVYGTSAPDSYGSGQGYAPQASYGAAAQPTYGAGMVPAPGRCQYHPELQAQFMCTSCGATFCKSCRKVVNNVSLCPLCGQFCKPFEEMRQRVVQAAEVESGFGITDLARAISYPFGNTLGLVIMACAYGLLLLAGWRGQLLATSLTFCCMSIAINRLSMGKVEEGFMPDISGGLFDVFLSPLKLAFGVTIVTFGPLIVLFFMGLGSVFSGGGLAVIGPLLLGAVVAGVWAAFYYPMALLVAGFTQSFLATINPLVGLDTIRRMGMTYVKAYFMCLVAFVIQIALAGIFHLLTLTDSRSLPAIFMVLCGMILQGGAQFYGSMVTAAILGFALYKSQDKLDLGF